MDDVEKKEKDTPLEPTEEKTEKDTTDVGAVAKETPEPSDRLDKHPRFQEVIKEKNEWRQKYEDREREEKIKSLQPETPQEDPYAGMNETEKQQTKAFVDKYIQPEIRKAIQPFAQQVQTQQLNEQIKDAKTFASKHDIDFDKKLPEIVDYLSRSENRGRLTATEAIRNMYFDEMMGTVKNQTVTDISKEKEGLMEKKKQANLLSSGVAQPAVIQSDNAAKAKMSPAERLQADVKKAIELGNQGVRHPKVIGD